MWRSPGEIPEQFYTTRLPQASARAMQSSSPSYISLDGAVSEACIYRRNGGCAVLVDAKLYVWGGEGAEQRVFPTAADEDEEDDSDSDDEVEVVDVWTVTSLPPPRLKLTGAPFDVFDMNTCSWSRQKTAGDIPLLGLGITSIACFAEILYKKYLCVRTTVIHAVTSTKLMPHLLLTLVFPYVHQILLKHTKLLYIAHSLHRRHGTCRFIYQLSSPNTHHVFVWGLERGPF